MCFESLPLSVLSNALAWLPADERPRAALVCRRFRDALQDDHAVWASVDFSQSKASQLNDRLLRQVAAKAGEHLTRLVLGEWVTTRQPNGQAVFSRDVVLGVVRSPPALRCLALHTSAANEFTTTFIRQLVATAPQLVALETDVFASSSEEACALLRNEAPFGAVRLRRLRVRMLHTGASGFQLTSDGLLAIAGQLASRRHFSLCELAVESHRHCSADVFNTLVDVLAPRRMAALCFIGCLPYNSDGVVVSGVARLLHGGFLTRLVLNGWSPKVPILNDASAPSLAATIRACHTLTCLTLSRVSLWDRPACGNAVVASLVGHPSIRELELRGNEVSKQHRSAVGKPLAQLVAANAPALAVLRLNFCSLGGAGLRSLFCALPGNTFLRELDCSYNYGPLRDKAPRIARHVLGAVTANSALTALRLGNHSHEALFPDFQAAEAVVAARAAAAAAAQ